MPDPHTPSGSARSYDVPADLDANDVSAWFEDIADSIDGHLDDLDAAKADLTVTVNAKTNDYTLVDGDSGEVITMDKATANTLTIGTGRPAGFTAVIVQLGAGQTTIAASGTALRATPGLKLRAQYSAATVIHLGSEVYLVTGDLSA